MAGRPLLTGEKRTEKLTLYLSESMNADIQDLSRIYAKPTALYVVDLISKDIETKRSKIDAFRALRNESENI